MKGATKNCWNLIMTRKELCEKYNISESSVKNNFVRLQKSFEKKGYILIKNGRGEKADYLVINKENHADTYLQSTKAEIQLTKAQFQDLKDFRFIVLLGIITCPSLTFRGTLSQFLHYIEMTDNKYNRQILQDSIQELVDKKFILYYNDTSTDEGYFIVSILRKCEVEMSLGIEMIQHCKMLSDKTGEKVTDLIKVWTAMGYAYYNQPFTMGELENLTGLSSYKIRKAKKILEGDGLFCTSRAYEFLEGEVFCLGQTMDFNIIPHENQELLKHIEQNT